jgi:hypothetical protein
VILLQATPLNTVKDAQSRLQLAIGVEFGTLPPYLYALYSIRPGTNAAARKSLLAIALQEMTHMCLDCNILNALGGNPVIKVQPYPGPLPGDIGPDHTPLRLHLFPFSRDAMQQGMKIEEPENAPDFPVRKALAAGAAPAAVTIGQFYRELDDFLKTLPSTAWTPNRNQISDDQFFAGQIFPIHSYDDAHKAITEIISEGEGTQSGTTHDPLDFQDQVAHFFRFGEIFHDRVLTKSNDPQGYAFGPDKFGVDWDGAYPAISDPGTHDFSHEPPAAQAAQNACNQAFTNLIDTLQRGVSGGAGALGEAVQAMFALRMAALHAFTVPLTDHTKVAGPAFLYQPHPKGGAR